MCAYRNLLSAADPALGRPFHRALVAANAGQLVWGSDWPHLRVSPRPDAAALLETFRDWTTDATIADRILTENPQALYA